MVLQRRHAMRRKDRRLHPMTMVCEASADERFTLVESSLDGITVKLLMLLGFESALQK